MSTLCTISIGDRSFPARAGDRILDAALIGGYDLPHECRSGHCGSCLVRVRAGHVIGGESTVPGAVHACQAVVLSSLRLEHDEVPPVSTIDGEVIGLAQLCRDVVEVTIATAEPFAWLPGQYASFSFAGFPARAYSPTVALDGSDRPGTFRLHVKRLREGRVSGAIGREIGPGHRVLIEGPHGSAFLRPRQQARLVLFAGGTGFAPIWAIADAALREWALRSIVVIAATRSIYTFYMSLALERMAGCRNVAIVPVVAEPQNISPHLRTGAATDFAPVMAPGDIVHAAGAPAMVETLAMHAAAADIALHADPFMPSHEPRSGWFVRAAERVGTARRRLLSQAGAGLLSQAGEFR